MFVLIKARLGMSGLGFCGGGASDRGKVHIIQVHGLFRVRGRMGGSILLATAAGPLARPSRNPKNGSKCSRFFRVRSLGCYGLGFR